MNFHQSFFCYDTVIWKLNVIIQKHKLLFLVKKKKLLKHKIAPKNKETIENNIDKSTKIDNKEKKNKYIKNIIIKPPYFYFNNYNTFILLFIQKKLLQVYYQKSCNNSCIILIIYSIFLLSLH